MPGHHREIPGKCVSHRSPRGRGWPDRAWRTGQGGRLRSCAPATRLALLATVGAAIAVLAGPVADRGAPGAQAPARAGVRLSELYAEVLRANPRLTAARALARAAEARISAAGRPPDPQLQIGAMNYMLPQLVPMDPLGMVQLQVMQMVPINGTLALATRAAAAQSAAMRARTDEVSWALRSQVAMAFFELSATDRNLDVMRETLRLLSDIAATAASMYRVGEGRQADVLRARVEIARMTEDTIRMQAMRETMVARLNALADRDAEVPIGTPAPPRFPDAFPSRPWLDSVAALNRPMVRAALEEVRAAEAGERMARRALIPDLQVGVQYGQRGASRFQGDEMGGTQRMGSLMIGASIPIFARARQLQLREEAAAMRAMAQAEVAVVRAETRGGLGEAHAALTRARQARATVPHRRSYRRLRPRWPRRSRRTAWGVSTS